MSHRRNSMASCVERIAKAASVRRLPWVYPTSAAGRAASGWMSGAGLARISCLLAVTHGLAAKLRLPASRKTR